MRRGRGTRAAAGCWIGLIALATPLAAGVIQAPTLANLDGDANLEIVLNTAHSGFVAYELPDSADARILWATGRGSYRRSGVAYLIDIFEDGFESGDVGEWSASNP